MRICGLLLLFSVWSTSLWAQQTFTEHLTRQVAGEGTVTLSQDAEIQALVNGLAVNTTAATHPHINQTPDTTNVSGDSDAAKKASMHRMHAVGFRIQVYAGGNNRQSKSEAYQMAGLVRSHFNDVPVYTSFLSPRWVCRVGDFKTREEAVEQLRKMRQTGQFGEASIVKSKIIVYY